MDPSAQSPLLNPAQRPVILVGIEVGVFRALTQDATSTLTVQSLAAMTQCDDGLPYRFMRYFFSIGVVTEYPDLTYGANPTTFWLATEAAEAHVASLQLEPSRQISQPASLDFRARANPQSDRPSNPASPQFHTFSAMPAITYRFAELMRARRRSARDWTAAFPVRQLRVYSHRSSSTMRASPPETRTLFVDVGGARGSQCVSLRQRYPQLQGHVVVQDRAAVLALADADALRALDITTMVHDLLAPQPILHAKAYYLRHVLHEWLDDACVTILRSIETAIADDSVLLIDEMIRPESTTTQHLPQGQRWVEPILTPLTIMERTEAQWRTIIIRAGLRVDRIRLYEPILHEGVIVVSRYTMASGMYIPK